MFKHFPTESPYLTGSLIAYQVGDWFSICLLIANEPMDWYSKLFCTRERVPNYACRGADTRFANSDDLGGNWLGVFQAYRMLTSGVISGSQAAGGLRRVTKRSNLSWVRLVSAVVIFQANSVARNAGQFQPYGAAELELGQIYWLRFDRPITYNSRPESEVGHLIARLSLAFFPPSLGFKTPTAPPIRTSRSDY